MEKWAYRTHFACPGTADCWNRYPRIDIQEVRIAMLYLVKATGESMRFVINNGDMLLLQADSKPLKFGDVIVYRDNCREGLVCHRYYFRIGKWLITAGDNCLRFELVNKDRFYGYVVVSTVNVIA